MPTADALKDYVGTMGKRILPACYSDNDVSLLPGEKRDLVITCAEKDAAPAMNVTLEG